MHQHTYSIPLFYGTQSKSSLNHIRVTSPIPMTSHRKWKIGYSAACRSPDWLPRGLRGDRRKSWSQITAGEWKWVRQLFRTLKWEMRVKKRGTQVSSISCKETGRCLMMTSWLHSYLSLSQKNKTFTKHPYSMNPFKIQCCHQSQIWSYALLSIKHSKVKFYEPLNVKRAISRPLTVAPNWNSDFC